MRTILTRFAKGKIILPKLINGKVCVYNPETREYTLHNKSKYCEIEDNFIPENYVILHNYNDCLAYSKEKEKDDWEVEKALCEYMENHIDKKKYRAGDKVHMKSYDGIYEIVSINYGVAKITCSKWKQQKANPYRLVLEKDIKCLAGGLYNMVK